MSSNVVEFHGITKLDLPPDRVLNRAKDADLQSVVTVGWDQEGDLYFASSAADAGEVIFLLQRAIWRLNKIMDQQEELDHTG